jgi:hypothetical protein
MRYLLTDDLWAAGEACSAQPLVQHRLQWESAGRAVLLYLFQTSWGRGTIKSENCNPTTS